MKKQLLLFFCSILLLAAPLAGCTTGESPAGAEELLAWIDAPLNEARLPLAPYDVVVHGAAPGGLQSLEVSINGSAVQDLELDDASLKLVTGIYRWNPEEPGEYIIAARSQDSVGNWSSTAQAVVYIDGAAGVEAEEPETPEVQAEVLPATETLTPTPCSPMAAFLMDGNCRRGPSTGYTAVTSLEEGASAAVEGRSQDSSWWYIALPESSAHCWVSAVVVETSCIPEDMPWIVAEPMLGAPEPSTDTFYWRSGEPRAVTIRIPAGGESPLTGVSITFKVGDEDWKTMAMADQGNGTWSITIHAPADIPGAVDTTDAAFRYYFTAKNQFGLSVQSPTYADIRLKNME